MIIVSGQLRTLLLTTLVFISSCASFNPQRDKHDGVREQAIRPTESATHAELLTLPLPKGTITAAVYGFQDLTGQNRPAPSSTLSSAVTQGAANLLIKALLDSRWFRPLERNGLQNLLTERNLWNQRLATNAPQAQELAPLPAASILLEGGVIAYETNIRTGGSGAQYLGIGGSQQYREDSVTINLRAINAQNGSILHSVNSNKSIFSRSVNYGLFGFVKFDAIAELEAGYAFNEPIQRAVEEAIESGLIQLILEGVLNESWDLKEPCEIAHPSFRRFTSVEGFSEYSAKHGISISSSNGVKQVGTSDGKQGAVKQNIGCKQIASLGSSSKNITTTTVGDVNGDGDTSELAVADIVDDSGHRDPLEGLEPIRKVNSGAEEGPEVESTTDSQQLTTQATNSVAGVVQPPSLSSAAVAGPSSELYEVQASTATQAVEAAQRAQVAEQLEVTRRAQAERQSEVPKQIKAEEKVQESEQSQADEAQGFDPDAKSIMIFAGIYSDVASAQMVHRAVDDRIQGIEVSLVQIKMETDEPPVYRIRLGPIEKVSDAELVAAELIKMEIKNIEAEQMF